MVGNVDFRLLEAVLQILSDRGAGYDIEEASLDVATYQAHRIGLQVVADFVFLRGYVQYIHVDHRNGNVLVADSAYEFFRYDSFFFQIATYYITDCAE